MSYTLDSLNRRVGVSAYNEQTAEWEVQVPGVQIWEDTNKDAVIDASEILEQTHEIDQRGGLTGLNDGTAVEAVGQDVAGAITDLHGREVYYDWLGRPVLIHDSNTGKPVASMTYDAFGRLATRKALWPGQSKSTVYRNETYYYDGVRRIQEVFTDPVDATPPWPVAPGDEPLNSDGGDAHMEAEYIWSAASGQPFDTCHVQIDWWDREAWFIQDHQTGTVRGYVDANGELVEQYRFDAFGNLLGVDSFALSSSGQLFEGFRQRLGHQGLFAERVDGTTLDPVLVSVGEQWYQSRSRWYVPELGRFLTSDPNATGIPTQSSLAMLGRMPAGPPSGSFGWEGHYGDGWDVYTAYGANPIMHQDPSGLFFLGFIGGGGVGMDIYADYGDEVMGAGAEAAGYVNSSFQDAAYAQAHMVDMIMDWDISHLAMTGMNASGMTFQTAGSYAIASASGGLAASWATAAAAGFDKHHIIPRFLMGRYSWANRMDLPSGLHSELHDHINRAFAEANLPAPSSNKYGKKNAAIGQLSWREAFKLNRVTPEMLQRAQRAMMSGAKSFDAAHPGYRVAANFRFYMNKASAVGAAGRLIRYGGRI